MKYLNTLLIPLISLILMLSINSITLGITMKKYSTPKIPQQLTVTKLYYSEVDLKWNAVPGATGYKVYRSNSSNSKFVLIGKTLKNSYKNIKLRPSTTFWYYMTAYNSHKTSNASKHVKSVTKQKNLIAKKFVLGFATNYYSGDVSSYNSIIENVSTINQVATATFEVNKLGSLSGNAPLNVIAYANKNKIETLAMISNNFDGNIAKSILESSHYRQNLIANILQTLKSNSYKGVNIDIEGIFPGDRTYFSTFIKELYSKLHPLGFIVSVSVPAKTTDNVHNPWSGAYDYIEIGKYANSVVIMAYDEHYLGGSAGPIASIVWVKAIAAYAASVIPKNKILLGIDSYGYDWSTKSSKGYGISGINELALKYKAKIIFDPIAKSPHFTYKDSAGYAHNVWFENSASISYKLDIVNSLNLSGTAVWRLGLENRSFWTTIRTKLNI